MWTSIVMVKFSTRNTLKEEFDVGLQNISDVPITIEITHNC